MVLFDGWTLEQMGVKQIDMTGKDDKWEITALLACMFIGKTLPPHIIYTDKTELCHTTFIFPKDWDIHHIDNHWSYPESTLHYINKIIVPYVEKHRESLPLKQHKQKAPCIFYIFAAYRHESVLAKLKENIDVVFVPTSCTDMLQHLDVAINKSFKDYMKAAFNTHY